MSDTLASLSAGNRSLILKLSTPTDWNNTKPRNDLSAIKVWCSTTAGFTPGDTSLVFSGPVSSSITIPNLSDNTTYYVKYAFISSIDATVFTYSKQYTQTTLTSTSGTNGASTYRIYIAAANSSATPTTPSTTQNGATPTGWSATPVTLTGTQAQFQSDGVTPAGSTTTTWSTPYLSYFKVDTLEAITTNTGSLTVTGTFKAGTAVISGTTMTGAGGVLYNGGNFAFGDSTTNITYNGTTLSLNGQVVYNGNIQPLAVTGDKVASGTLTADKIDARGLSIKDTAGNIILSAGSSLATSSFSGNVTGSVNGTSVSTLVTTANTANSTANTANSTANTALSNAATAQSTANAKLAKSGADILTGPINLNAANALTVGTPALDSVSGHNGFYIGSTGIVGTKNGAATFTLDNNGNAVFAGSLTAASGTFVGNVTGSVDGTSASTLVTTATTASTNASNALTNAATAQSTANAKLAKSGADILTGPINLNAATAILVGTTSDGLYLGNTGIVGRKAGATTFSVDASGNAIFAGSLSAATGSFAGSLSAATGTFGGNVTGSVDGTSATTLVSTANTANSTANTANSTANTANSTANTANSTANTANSTANTALTNAATAQSTANAKLAKSGADTLVGPISLTASNAILVGTINDGLYLGSTGIVGRKASQTTFAVDASGNAIFKGDLTGASGTFTGNLTVGSSPAVSGTTMTGSGGVINTGGTFALGNNTTNIAFNGSVLTLNGNIVATGNIVANAVTTQGGSSANNTIQNTSYYRSVYGGRWLGSAPVYAAGSSNLWAVKLLQGSYILFPATGTTSCSVNIQFQVLTADPYGTAGEINYYLFRCYDGNTANDVWVGNVNSSFITDQFTISSDTQVFYTVYGYDQGQGSADFKTRTLMATGFKR